jgi:hypothetical protein
MGDDGGGPGRPPFWRTPVSPERGLTPVTLKIIARHTLEGRPRHSRRLQATWESLRVRPDAPITTVLTTAELVLYLRQQNSYCTYDSRTRTVLTTAELDTPQHWRLSQTRKENLF